uniref:Uncharacterized protein n=1 Tax=Setaria italica TaxID=4555 RepID=K3ZXA9_SETIT
MARRLVLSGDESCIFHSYQGWPVKSIVRNSNKRVDRLHPKPRLMEIDGCPPLHHRGERRSAVAAARGGERGEASKMSGNAVVKKVADAAAKAGKAIDWDGLAKMLVSEEARKEFATLRRTFEDVNHQLQTKFSQEPQPIDWEYYRKGIGSKVVDMYKEAYESKHEFSSPSCLCFWELLRY